MSVLYGILLFGLVSAFVLAPVLRRNAATDRTESPELADLEARRESKYREIRDAELDHASGKLSDEDFARQDAELRSEAIGILDELDRVRAAEPGQGRPAAPGRSETESG